MPLDNGMPTEEELRSLTSAEIHARIDQTMSGSLNDSRLLRAAMFREELARRQQSDTNGKMLAWTRQMRNMTIAILIFTVVNVLVVWCSR